MLQNHRKLPSDKSLSFRHRRSKLLAPSAKAFWTASKTKALALVIHQVPPTSRYSSWLALHPFHMPGFHDFLRYQLVNVAKTTRRVGD